jgi:hypothetical protein
MLCGVDVPPDELEAARDDGQRVVDLVRRRVGLLSDGPQGVRVSLGCLRPPLAGDALDDPLPVLLVAVAHRARVHPHPHGPAVAGAELRPEVSRDPVGVALAVPAFAVLRIDVERGRVDPEQRLPLGKSQDFHHGGVDVDHLAARRGPVDADRQVVDEAAVTLLGRQRLRPLALDLAQQPRAAEPERDPLAHRFQRGDLRVVEPRGALPPHQVEGAGHVTIHVHRHDQA